MQNYSYIILIFVKSQPGKKNKKSKYRLNCVILNRRVFLIIRECVLYTYKHNGTKLSLAKKKNRVPHLRKNLSFFDGTSINIMNFVRMVSTSGEASDMISIHIL